MQNSFLKTLINQIGNLLILMGIIFIVPTLVSLIYSEWYTAIGFIISSIFSFCFGYLIQWLFKSAEEPHYKNVVIIVAIGWLFLTIIGGIPFYIVSLITPEHIIQVLLPKDASYTSSIYYFRNFLHCIFESMSAYTTTGLTMAVHEPSIGKGLLFYRSFAQWVGGAGFIILALAVLKQDSSQSSLLYYKFESFGDKLTIKVKETARGIWKAYSIITILTTIYLIVGTYLILPEYPLISNIFDSINHAMAGLSSGGFSTLDDSIAGYQSSKMDYLYLLPMMLGSFSLPFYYKIFYQRKVGQIWKDIQTRYLILFFIFGSLGLYFLLHLSESSQNPFREGVFQFISAISTTGWQTSNIYIWDTQSTLYIIFVAMFIGGAAGGTVGGIKMIRALIIQKGLRWQINKTFLSKNTIKTIRFNGKTLLPEYFNAELASATSFALLFIIILFSCSFITSFFIDTTKYSISAILFESIAAQSTAGLTVGITDPSMNPVVEIIYIFQMWIGRLEIIPIFALLRAIILGTNHKFM